MKKLIIVVILLIAAWVAYWFIAKNAVTSGVEDKIESYRAQGYIITHNDLEVSGFPLRFNMDAGPVIIEAPQTAGRAGAKAQLDTADIMAAAYLPTNWSLTHSGKGQFDIPAGLKRWAFETQTGAAKIDVGARVTGGLSSISVDAGDITVTNTGSAPLPIKSLETVYYGFSQSGSSATYSLSTRDIELDAGSLGKLGQALGPDAEKVSGIMHVDGYGSETPLYECTYLFVVWGKADLGGNFTLTQSPGGLSGKIALNVANESELISELTSKGIISGGEAMIAGLIVSGLPETEDGRRQITLTVSDNRVSLGPIKLGKLPF